MTEKIAKIDIPAARAQIVRTIAIYEKRAKLAGIVEPFFKELPANVNARAAKKLHEKLVEEIPELKVYRVDFDREKAAQGTPVRFTISMYDMDDLGKASFLLMPSPPDTETHRSQYPWDIDLAMIADRRWLAQAVFLRNKLEKFAYRANKFNALVDELKALSGEMCMVPGDHYPVFPMSDFFYWYQLN